ncbi:hypothetical protein T484DRAFT_1665040 [Baffinella frigidus]|nr:hypothetical protein T484DRAFT_1665040 [Cryptophyta sp. CCMP2293]
MHYVAGHTITDSDLRPFGVGIYPLAALANHACLPNCVQTFKGTAITIRAMREIPSGEEVTIAYVDVATPLVQRKADLKERYLFECECGGCSGEEAEAREASKVAWKSDHVSEELRDEALKLAEEACISAEKMRGSADEVLERVLEACAKCEVVLDPLHVSLMRLREHALRLSITIANWEEAERQCEATIAPYRAHYPEGSPLVGLQLATLGKIKAFLGRDLEARNNLSEAAPLLLRAFGQGDPCVKETEERLREVMWSMDGLGEMAERTRAIQPPR